MSVQGKKNARMRAEEAEDCNANAWSIFIMFPVKKKTTFVR